jgi:hypothetical protein
MKDNFATSPEPSCDVLPYGVQAVIEMYPRITSPKVI